MGLRVSIIVKIENKQFGFEYNFNSSSAITSGNSVQNAPFESFFEIYFASIKKLTIIVHYNVSE